LLKLTEPDTDRQANAWRFFFAGSKAGINPEPRPMEKQHASQHR
jgi:hypothetical protein